MNRIFQKDIFISITNLLAPDLTSTQKILINFIIKGSNSKGCFINNASLGNLVNLTNKSCHNLITDIVKKNYLKNSHVNYFNVFNKNAKTFKNITASRIIIPITDDFDYNEMMIKFSKNIRENERMVKKILQNYNDLDLNKCKINFRNYILIYRDCTIIGEDKVNEAIKNIAGLPAVKKALSFNSIFRISILRFALGKNKETNVNNLEIFFNNCIEFMNVLKEEGIIL